MRAISRPWARSCTRIVALSPVTKTSCDTLFVRTAARWKGTCAGEFRATSRRTGKPAQSISIATAVASPPPMHRLAMPRFLP